MVDYWTRVARGAEKLGVPHHSFTQWMYRNNIPSRWHYQLFKAMELEPCPFTWEELVFPPPPEKKRNKPANSNELGE